MGYWYIGLIRSTTTHLWGRQVANSRVCALQGSLLNNSVSAIPIGHIIRSHAVLSIESASGKWEKKKHTRTRTHTHTRKVLHLEDTLLANDNNNNNNNNNNSNPSFFFYDSLTRFRPKKIIIVNYVHLCSKESVRFDLYPLSLRLPSCLNDGKESHGESRLCPV